MRVIGWVRTRLTPIRASLSRTSSSAGYEVKDLQQLAFLGLAVYGISLFSLASALIVGGLAMFAILEVR